MATQKNKTVLTRLIIKVKAIANQIKQINADIVGLKNRPSGGTVDRSWKSYTPGHMPDEIKNKAVLVKVTTTHPIVDITTLIGISYGDGSDLMFGNGARANFSTGKIYDVYWTGYADGENISLTFIQKKDASSYKEEFTPSVIHTHQTVSKIEWRPL